MPVETPHEARQRPCRRPFESTRAAGNGRGKKTGSVTTGLSTDTGARLDRLEALLEQIRADQIVILERLAPAIDAEPLSAAAPRDRYDTALRHTLAARTRGLAFQTGDLLCHATTVDPILLAALGEAAIGTTAELGAWLRHQRGVRAGIEVARLPRRRWRVTYTTNT